MNQKKKNFQSSQRKKKIPSNENKKNPSIFKKFGHCVSFYTGEKNKKCHYAACEKVNFYVICIKGNSPHPVAREYHNMHWKKFVKAPMGKK